MADFASVADNLRRSAARFPGRCAVEDGAVSCTYRELLDRATALAAHLQHQGLSAGDRVALILNNSVDFVAAYYGTLLAGGIAVLLNAAAKSRDLTAWLRDSEPAFAFLEGTDADEGVGASGVPMRVWRRQEAGGFAMGEQEPPAASIVARRRDDPACILYTSGTTGSPKGAVLSHGNLISNTDAIVEYLELTENDSIVTILPFYYSYGSSVLNTHVRAGARIVLERNFVYPHMVVETLSRKAVTGFAGVPSTFALLTSRVKLQDYALPNLRYVTQAGGAMSPALTQKLRSMLPGTKVIVMYGQTEAAARLTYLPPAYLDAKLGSVGIPIPGVQIEIRNELGHACVANEVGEVWARGPNVMLGYWRNEAASREVLRDGWLKTGDMGRLDVDGFLYLVGRRSDMIKAGAHRVHPVDIEETIAELPQVQEVAVVGVDDEILGQSIKAFVVLAGAEQLTPMQVQAHCRARLANYKVPKTVEMVASLPRTASGKIRRMELIERTQ